MDTQAVFHYLCENRRSADDIPDHKGPGVYAIFAACPDCLPGIKLPQSGLVYVGHGKDLAKRTGDHFTAQKNRPSSPRQKNRPSSPRRSLGALLKSKLGLKAEPWSGGRSESNYRNYRFADNGEEDLSAWMRRNLRCAIYPFNGDTGALEKQLIEENEPPLNLKDWPNPYKEEIEKLRKQCREEAKRTLSGSA